MPIRGIYEMKMPFISKGEGAGSKKFQENQCCSMIYVCVCVCVFFISKQRRKFNLFQVIFQAIQNDN